MTQKIILILIGLTVLSCSTSNNEKKERNVSDIEQKFIEAAKGNANAQFSLGFKYYFGDQVALNRDSAKYWLQKAADNGHVDAQKSYDAFFKIIPSINSNDSIK